MPRRCRISLIPAYTVFSPYTTPVLNPTDEASSK